MPESTTEGELQSVWDQMDRDMGEPKRNVQRNRLVEELMQRQPGLDKSSAYALATSILQGHGYMEGGKQTNRGLIREQFPEGRKGGKDYQSYIKDREAQGDKY